MPRPRGLVVVVLAAWLLLPFAHWSTPAQDAVPLLVAAELAGSRPDSVYLEDANDLYDLPTEFRERSCRFWTDRAECERQAVAFISSPAALPLLGPLSWLPDRLAVLAVRLLASVAAVVAFLFLLARLPGLNERGAALLALAFTIEVNHQVALGQTSALLLLLAAVPLTRVRTRQQELLLALGIAAAVALKAFPVVLIIPLILSCRWRVVAFVSGLGSMLALASLAFGGVELWRDFLASAGTVGDASASNPYNGSVSGVLEDVVSADLASSAGLALGIALVVTFVVLCRRASPIERWALALPLALLVLPQVWGHYLATAFALVVVVSAGTSTSTLAAVAGALLLVPYAVLAGTDTDVPAYQLLYLLGALVFAAATIARRPIVRVLDVSGVDGNGGRSSGCIAEDDSAAGRR